MTDGVAGGGVKIAINSLWSLINAANIAARRLSVDPISARALPSQRLSDDGFARRDQPRDGIWTKREVSKTVPLVDVRIPHLELVSSALDEKG